MVSLKEVFLFSAAAAAVFAYMLLHFLGNFIGSELHTVFILCIFAYYGLLCFIVISRSSHVRDTFDLTDFRGTKWLVNSIGTLFALIVICIVEEGMIGMAQLLGTAMDDPWSVVKSALFFPWMIEMISSGQSQIQELYYAWYLTFAILSFILGVFTIGRYHKARKMIAIMELCKRENAAGDRMSADYFAEKIKEPNKALIMSIPKEDMIPDAAEYRRHFPPAGTAKPPDVQTLAEEQYRECPLCGSRNLLNSDQCSFCGIRLEEGDMDA